MFILASKVHNKVNTTFTQRLNEYDITIDN